MLSGYGWQLKIKGAEFDPLLHSDVEMFGKLLIHCFICKPSKL